MLQMLLQGLGATLTIWVGAVVLALVLAVPVSMLRRANNVVLRSLGTVWVGVARGVPPLVWMIILYYGVTFGPTKESPIIAAIVALGLINSAYFGDSIRAGLDSVPKLQWEGARAVALPRIVTLRRVVLPQAFPIMLASTAAYSISLLKNTAIASIIGARDIVYYAYTWVQMGNAALTAFFVAGLIYLAFTIPVGFFARWIEGRSVIAKVR